MPITAERLRVEVEADTSRATKAMDDMESKGNRIPGWAKAAGAALAGAFAVDKIVSGVRVAVSAASDLQQSVGGVEAVFAQNADQVSQWAAGSAKALGLSKNQYNEFATIVGSQLKNMGMSLDEATGQTGSLITMGADLAATFGGSTSEAVGALSSLLRGETDPIERYGVSIKQADIAARLAEQGLSGLTGEAAKQAQAQAVLGLLTEQTAAAQGKFSSESGTFAGVLQRLSAGSTNLAATIGGALLPAGTGLLTWASDAVDALGGWLPGAIERGQAAASGLADLLRGEFSASVRESLGVEEDSPLVMTLLTIGDTARSVVGEVSGGLRAMFAAFREGGDDVTSSGIAGVLESIGLAARNFIDPLVGAFRDLGPTIGPLIGQVAQAAAAFNPLGLVMRALTPLLPQVGAMLGQVASVLLNGLGQALQVIVPALAQVASTITGALTGALMALMPAITTLLPQIAGLASTLVSALLPVITALYPVLAQVASVVIGALAQAFVALLPTITSLVPIVAQVAQVVGDVLLVAVEALGPLLTMLADVFASLVPALVPVIDAVMQVVKALLPIVGVVGDLIGALLPPLVALFMALLQPVLDLIAPLVGALAPILTMVAQIISTSVVPMLTTLADWLARLVTFILPVVSAITGGLVGALSAMIGWVLQAVGAVASFASDGIGAFGRFADGARDKIGDAIGFVTGIPGKVMGVFAGAAGWLVNSGQAIIQGLIDGVKGMASKVTDAVSGVLEKARDLLPFSPAKTGPFSGKGWTLYSGRSISQALAQGIGDNTDMVRRAALGMVDAASVSLPGVSVGGVGVAAVTGAPGVSAGASPADALGVGGASATLVPDTMVLVDQDGQLIGRMRVEAGKVATGQVTPLDEGQASW